MPKKTSELTAATAIADADLLAIVQGGTSKKVTVGIAMALPTNYIGGLITSVGTDTDHDIDIAVGVARDSTDVDNMRLAAVLTKQIDAAWAVGTDDGGMDTGAVGANLMYAIWLIKRSDTGVVDALFSLSFTAPTMPANYDRKRLIGALKSTGGNNIVGYIQTGDQFRYLAAHPEDVSDNSLTTGVLETGTLNVPPNSRAYISLHLSNPTTTDTFGRATVVRKGETATPATADAWIYTATSGTFDEATVVGEILVDENRQIEYAAVFTDGNPTLKIRVFGFKMLTRREP